MSSLRRRLLLAIVTSFALFWAISSAFTLVSLRDEFRDALDERLAASARMVAALMRDAPQLALGSSTAPPAVLPALAGDDSVACVIERLRGGVIGQTANSPASLAAATPGLQTRTINGVTWRSYTLEQDGIRITTADRVDRRQQLFRNIALATFVPFLIAMMATLGSLGLAIKIGLRPLERVRQALGSRDPDALHPLGEEQVPLELLPLVSTVNGLLHKVERTIARERRFTGDAAHELRTPLTAIKTHLQVARRSTDPHDIRTALENAEHGVRRLHETIDQLLMLARVEASVPFAEDQRLDTGAIAEQAVAGFQTTQPGKLLIWNHAEGAIPAVPAALAVIALRNLLDNAFRHGAKGNKVELSMVTSGTEVTFAVTDDGAGMNQEDRAKAGERFWRKGSGHGSGLGLSIVDAIVTRYGGSWTLAQSAAGGLEVRMTLPAVFSDRVRRLQ